LVAAPSFSPECEISGGELSGTESNSNTVDDPVMPSAEPAIPLVMINQWRQAVAYMFDDAVMFPENSAEPADQKIYASVKQLLCR